MKLNRIDVKPDWVRTDEELALFGSLEEFYPDGIEVDFGPDVKQGCYTYCTNGQGVGMGALLVSDGKGYSLYGLHHTPTTNPLDRAPITFRDAEELIETIRGEPPLERYLMPVAIRLIELVGEEALEDAKQNR